MLLLNDRLGDAPICRRVPTTAAASLSSSSTSSTRSMASSSGHTILPRRPEEVPKDRMGADEIEDNPYLRSLQEANDRLRAETKELRRRLSLVTASHKELDDRVKRLARENADLRQARATSQLWQESWTTLALALDQLKHKVRDRLETPRHDGTGNYAYDLETVVPLTKLVCQDLKNRPAAIDADKIFGCVVGIAWSLPANAPTRLRREVRMLLAVCLASTWFTKQQKAKLQQLGSKHGPKP